MYSSTETSATLDQLKTASPEQLRLFYAAKASVNTNFSTPSLPPTVSKVYTDTAANQGERLALMAVSEYQGMLQNFFVGLLNAKRIIEIGTFTGASAIFFANALKRNGVAGGRDADGNKPIISLELSDKYAEIARQNFVDAGVDDYIDVIVGDARENLARLAGQTFDIAFVDADKPSYPAYYDTIVDKNMLAKGGLIIADNTAFDCVTPFIGVPAPVASDAVPIEVSFSYDQQLGLGQSNVIGKALHEFNEYVRKDPRSEVVMLPLFTGISLIRLLDA
ncbi:hypothetical protein IWW50_006856 [Coemansia erecta]|nr:hypothetical protein GGF43_005052 [Coemansia sp. RSA 2618]KAJ2815331.1 hypothetical protein IWW50_006856 [Coemansia erecta]